MRFQQKDQSRTDEGAEREKANRREKGLRESLVDSQQKEKIQEFTNADEGML